MGLAGNRPLFKKWSPYQALFLDPDMLAAVKPGLENYLDALEDGHKIAEDQVKEKFPNGFNFPESNYDFNSLAVAITHDQQLIQTDKPNAVTIAALEKIRKDFKPGIVKEGHPFNMNDFINAYQVYFANFHWEINQKKLFSKCLLGFLERLMTRFYLMSICQDPIKFKIESFKRYVEVDDYVHDDTVDINGIRKKLIVIPLDGDSSCRLGEDFMIDGRYAFSTESVLWSGWLAVLINHVKQIQKNTQDLCYGQNKRDLAPLSRKH